MNLQEIEREARRLMTAHGVGSLAFEFDRGKRRIGATHFRGAGVGSIQFKLPTKITLSKHFAVLLSEQEIREVILHEIAHALAGYDANHGPKWKAHARALGIEAKACKATTVRPEYSVKGECSTCGKVVHSAHRLPLRVYFHHLCGGPIDGGLIHWYREGKRVRFADMPARYRTEFTTIRHREDLRNAR